MSIKKIIRKVIPYQVRLAVNPLWKFLRHASYRERAHYKKACTRKPVYSCVIFYEAYHGESMTGNPYAIFTYLLNNVDFEAYTHVWAVRDPQLVPEEVRNRSNVVIVNYRSAEYTEYLAKAKYLVNDTTFPAYFAKRPEQVYINTWHGTPLKTMGIDIKQRGYADHRNIQRNFLMTDYFVSPNQYTYQKLLASHDVATIYQGKILDTGSPRVDLMYQANHEKLRMQLGVGADQKIILYAPTWRGVIVDEWNENERLLNDVKRIQAVQDEDTVVLLKAHYYVQHFFKEKGFAGYLVPPSMDTNALLAVTDYLITDYSSIFFEFLPTGRPVVFYAYDETDYLEARGTYIPMDQLPGPVVHSIDGVIDTFARIDWIKKKYTQVYQEFVDRYCYHDDGHATERLVNTIFYGAPTDDLFNIGTDKTKILMYGGGFLNNGITSAAVNLLNTLDYDKYDVTLIDQGTNIKASKVFHMEKVNKNVHHLFRIGTFNATITDWYRHRLYLETGNRKFAKKNMYRAELKRLIGDAEFDIGVDFGGYSPFWTSLFAFGDFAKKTIYMHSDMNQEVSKKVRNNYPHQKNLRVIFSLYNKFDKIISVSKLAHMENKKNLAAHVQDESKMDYVTNPIDYEEILAQKEAPALQKMIVEFGGEFLPLEEDFEFDHTEPQTEDTNFITIGRLSPEKDHAKLIVAFSELIAKRPHVKLFIVGEGALEEELRRLVHQLHLEHNVIFTGHLDNPYALLDRCDCFVLSSNYEGQALVLIEALVLGKPVITTDIPGPRSVVQGGYGMIVENSVAGLAQGMEEFIHGEMVEMRAFDYKAYQAEAMQMFYEKVCDTESDSIE